MQPIDKTAEQAADAALDLIQREHDGDSEAQQACAAITADRLRSKLYIRISQAEHLSRPRWGQP